MSVNVSVMDTLVYVSTIMKNQRLMINNMQPGLRMANTTLQNILAPPLKYRWNRRNLSKAINTVGGTDYTVIWDDLGWIETQWLVDEKDTYIELQGAQSIARVSTKKRPSIVAPVYDDNYGNITIRFDATPDANYTANFDYQRKATYLSSPAATFGPVPDEFGYLYTKWMLAEGALLLEDVRQPQFLRDAVFSTLAMQDGLTEQQKAIMADQMLNMENTSTRSRLKTQQGSQARGTQ
jgi:hypothetical protein